MAKPERPPSVMRLAARYAAFASQSDDLQALQQEACQVAVEGLRADSAKLLVFYADNQEFLVVAGVTWQAGIIDCCRQEANIETSSGFAGYTGGSAISNAPGAAERSRTPRSIGEQSIVRRINVPVLGNGQTMFGVLEVEDLRVEEFAADDFLFLQAIAQSLGAARNRLMLQALHDEQNAHSIEQHRASLGEMRHRVRNDLQEICSSIDHERSSVGNAEQRAGYKRVSRRVLALAELYDHLLGAESGSTVEMGAYLGSLCLRIAVAADLSSRGIALSSETQPISLPVDRAGRLAIVVNELVANAAEHAFPDGQAGKIVVRLFARIADGTGLPVVTVTDNGCGFKGLQPGRAGLGLVNRLVRGAGGVLTRLDGAGTEWQIALL